VHGTGCQMGRGGTLACSEHALVLQAVFVRQLLPVQVEKFEYLPGMEQLLQRLRAAGNEMHAITNYPVWYKWIEYKLQLSQYLQWTFMSCEGPLKVRTPRYTSVT
jgi:hypothetical protein